MSINVNDGRWREQGRAIFEVVNLEDEEKALMFVPQMATMTTMEERSSMWTVACTTFARVRRRVAE